MVRNGNRLILVFLIVLANALICTMAFGQDMESPDEAVISEETGGGEAEIAEDEPAIPADIPTRETFELTGDDSATLGPSTAQYVQVFLGLVIVIFIIWGLSHLMKRFITARGLATSSETLKVLFTLSLSPTRTLYLVRLADRILLVGSSEGGLRTLAEITEPEEVSLILRDLEFKGNFDLNPFRSHLNSLMGEEGTRAEMDEDLDDRQRKLKGVLDRLRDSDQE